VTVLASAGSSGDGVRVSGGAGGVAARTDDLEHAAGALQVAAAGLAEVAGATARVAAGPALLASGLLAPVTLVRAEAALAAALVGPHGLVGAGVRLELLAVRLRAAAAGYEVAETGARGAVHQLELATGRLVVARALPLVPLAAATSVVTVPLAAASWRLGMRPPGAWSRIGGRLLEPLVAALPGAFAPPAGPLWHPGADVPGAAGVLAGVGRVGPLLHETGTARVVSARPVPTLPPAGVRDLLLRVSRCYPEAGVAAGAVRVEGVRGTDGRRSWVVEIPGTQVWSPVPGGNPADLTADVAPLGRATTAAAVTVVRALEVAGVRPGEPVLLAGHSLGGMLAAALAADAAFTRRFRVTHVVAAGSPLAGFAVRPGVAVLAVEHDDDLVPALDGGPDPDRPDWVTVRRTPQQGRPPAAAHDSLAYAETGGLVDASGDPSLRAWRSGLAPFLARPGATATALVVVGRRAG
jgi:hypothetical protein